MNAKRASLVAALVAAGLVPAHAQRAYINGVFVGIRDGSPVELIAWAEAGPRGMLTLTAGSFEDVPLISGVTRLLSNLPMWKPVGVMVASHEIFRDERAERRVLRFATRPLNISAIEIRVADLERREQIDRLFRSVRARDDNPAYVFLVLQSDGLVRYYPFRIALSDS